MDTPDPTHRAQRPGPVAALAALRAGHDRFRTGAAAAPTRPGPLAAVFACTDPQPEPAILFGGSDVFTVRTAGLAVGPAVLGSLEYAVAHLHLPLVVVLGHDACRLPCGSGDRRVRAVIATLRKRSLLLDAAVRSGSCAIHGMSWHGSRQALRSVRHTDPAPVRRAARLRPPTLRPPSHPSPAA
ncbi:Carbonic anhydrase [Micromonospora nigra]|uniref:Carbonic anhydrase n=1 Tax=Micromonospora nigra TaxID=145857 RepID=A0A1C6S893_9ACTN|nr:carbonic anhydrase [Micromonospora nigra]SCL25490.1 Carbonic anhydrase [Micromonospora nigra]